MAHRTLGITWDDNRVNIGVVEASFRRFELTGAYNVERETEDGTRLTVAQAIEMTPVGRLKPTDTILVTFPGDRVMYETVDLPFREPRRVNAALPFQIMESMPLPIDQLMVDYHVIEHKGKGMRVLASAVSKNDIDAFLKEVEKEGIEPGVVIPEGFELAVTGRTLAFEGTNIVILVKGSHLEMAVFQDTTMVNIRVVELKQTMDREQEASPDFLREVMLFAAAVSDFTGNSLSTLYMTGDAGEAVKDSVSQAVGTRVTLLDAEDLALSTTLDGIDLANADIRTLLLAAFLETISLRDTINLRKGNFASAAQYSLIKGKIKLIAVTAIAFFVLLGVRSYVRYNTLQKQYDASVTQVRQMTKALTGKASDNPEKAIKIMTKQLSYNAHVMPLCPVTSAVSKTFRLISEAGMSSSDSVQLGSDKGQSFAMEVESMRVDENQGYIRCQSDTIETMERFLEGMKKEDCFANVVTETTERISFRRHEGWQRFSLKFSLVQKKKKKKKKKTGGKKK